MKRILLLSLALLFALPMVTKAQMSVAYDDQTNVSLLSTNPDLLPLQEKPKKHEIKLGAGFWGVPLVHGIISSFTGASFSNFPILSGETKIKSRYYDSPYLTYFYNHSKQIAFGASFVYGKTNSITDIYQTLNGDKTETHNTNYLFFSFLVELKLTYFKRSMVELYGSFGLGGTLVHTDTKIESTQEYTSSNGFLPMASLSAFGIKVGKNVGGFLELGVGAKGLINAGVFVNF